MSAKFVLSKILGSISILAGILFLFAPDTLLNLLGLNYPKEILVLLSFIIRLVGIRNIASGIAMIITRMGINLHYWLWAYVVVAFLDAIVALSLGQDNAWRYLVPLWSVAILNLFAVGVAYGSDVALGWKRANIRTDESNIPEPVATFASGSDSRSPIGSGSASIDEMQSAEQI